MSRVIPVILAAAVLAVPVRAQGPPPQAMDAPFFQGQAMRALDEKVSLLVEQGKTAAAIEELRRVWDMHIPKLHPTYELKTRLLGRLAALYAATGAKEKSLETIKALLADVGPGTPAEAAAWLDAGSVYKTLGMTDEALKAFDRAIELSTRLSQSGGWRPPQGPRGGPPRDGPPPGLGRPEGDRQAPPPRPD
jgi:tetratricopeptide (TPR) repeat protein